MRLLLRFIESHRWLFTFMPRAGNHVTYFRPQRVLQDTPICRRTNLVSWSLPLATPLLLFPVPLPSAALFTATMLKAAVDSAETDVVAAQGETTKAIGAEEDDGDGTTARPPPKSVMNSDQEYMLESTAKKARKAGNSLPQVSKSTRVQRICQFKRYITHRELRYSHPIEPYFVRIFLGRKRLTNFSVAMPRKVTSHAAGACFIRKLRRFCC